MDDFFRRQRQNGMRRISNPGHPQHPQHSQHPQNSQPGHGSQPRQHQLGSYGSSQQRAPDGQHAIGTSGASSYGAYYQQQPAPSMGYGQPAAGYGQGARQGYGEAYNPTPTGVMYNVPSAGPQSSLFDTGHSYSSRQPNAMQMLSPDVSTASYFANDPSATTSAAMQAQAASAGYTGDMGSMSTGGLSTHAPAGSTSDQSAPTSASADTRDYADTNEAYSSYQRTLKEVFRGIRSGALESASESLLQISDWLLSNVESLGLSLDDEDLYDSRVRLWKNFNNAWLGLLEKQKQMLLSGIQLQRPPGLISLTDLKRMGRELIRLCDSVERFGLVDYEYGVWEERIMDGLTECVELYSQAERDDAMAEGSGAQQS